MSIGRRCPALYRTCSLLDTGSKKEESVLRYVKCIARQSRPPIVASKVAAHAIDDVTLNAHGIETTNGAFKAPKVAAAERSMWLTS